MAKEDNFQMKSVFCSLGVWICELCQVDTSVSRQILTVRAGEAGRDCGPRSRLGSRR